MLFVAVGCGSVAVGGTAVAMGHGIATAVMIACFGTIRFDTKVLALPILSICAGSLVPAVLAAELVFEKLL